MRSKANKSFIIISVDSAGNYYLGNRHFAKDSLKLKLQEESAKMSEKPIVEINADSNAYFRDVAEVIREAKSLGMESKIIVAKFQ